MGVILLLLVFIPVIMGYWKVFEKAGKPGWAALVPVYNLIVIIEISGRPTWWFVLCLIPIVNLVILIMVWIEICTHFGKDTGFALGCVFLPVIFVPILGFSDAQYQPAGRGMAAGGWPQQAFPGAGVGLPPANPAMGAFPPGTAVMVMAGDGQRYPGTVQQFQNGYYLCVFANGSQGWYAAQMVSV